MKRDKVHWYAGFQQMQNGAGLDEVDRPDAVGLQLAEENLD